MLLHYRELELRAEQKSIEMLENVKAFSIGDFVLGQPKPSWIDSDDGDFLYKGGTVKLSNGLCSELSAERGTDAFQYLMSCFFCGKDVQLSDGQDLASGSFSAFAQLLYVYGFHSVSMSLDPNEEFKKQYAKNHSVLSSIFEELLQAKLLFIADLTGSISYKEILAKETKDFVAKLNFYSERFAPGACADIEIRRNMPDTLHEISISIKRKNT